MEIAFSQKFSELSLFFQEQNPPQRVHTMTVEEGHVLNIDGGGGGGASGNKYKASPGTNERVITSGVGRNSHFASNSSDVEDGGRGGRRRRGTTGLLGRRRPTAAEEEEDDDDDNEDDDDDEAAESIIITTAGGGHASSTGNNGGGRGGSGSSSTTNTNNNNTNQQSQNQQAIGNLNNTSTAANGGLNKEEDLNSLSSSEARRRGSKTTAELEALAKLPWYKGVTFKDIKAITPTLLILLVGLLIMIFVIPYAFSSVIKQLEQEQLIEQARLAKRFPSTQPPPSPSPSSSSLSTSNEGNTEPPLANPVSQLNSIEQEEVDRMELLK